MPGDHLVQFYEDENVLVARVATFLRDGLSAGDLVTVIATDVRARAYMQKLESQGFDVEIARANGQITFLDARETLAQFMRNGEPDPDLFELTVGAVFEKHTAAGGGARLRAYGEMVDLLWAQGDRQAAIRVEELWNELPSRHSFTLLCAYAIAGFYKEPAEIQRVCATNTHVMTHGDAVETDQNDSSATALPPQYARRLAKELAYRDEVELALRNSLKQLRAKEQALEEREQQLRADITAQRMAEEELRRNERRMRLVTDALPTLVSYIDERQRYGFVSAAYERWFGCSRADIIGKSMVEVLGEDAYAVIQPHVERALAGAPVSFEADVPYRNGQNRFVEATYVPQAIDDGVPAGFVALVSDVTERKSLERFRAAAAKRAERLSKITAAIADAVSAAQVFEALVDRVYEAVDGDSVGLWLVDEDGRTARLVRGLGYSEAAKRHFESIELSMSPSVPVLDSIRRAEAVWIRSQAELVQRYPHLGAVVSPGRPYRVCCLPLIAQGRVLGALGLTIKAASEDDEDEREFLSLAARYASQAVERLRLLDAERRSRAIADGATIRMGVLSHASRVFMESDLELEPRLRDIVAELGTALSSCIGISLLKPDQLLHTVAVYHPVPEAQRLLTEIAKASPLKQGDGVTGSVMLTAKSVLIPTIDSAEMAQRAAPPYRVFLERFPIGAMICVPLRARGEVIGTVMATRTRPAETYTSDDLQLFEELTDRAGAAIDNARLHRATLDAHKRAEQLYRFAQAVVVADTIESVFDAALAAIDAALGAKRAAILRFDGEGVMRFVAFRHLSESYRGAAEGHSPWPRDATMPQAVLVPDARREPSMANFASLFEREGIGALAFIPLVSRGRLLGKFMVYYDEAHPFPVHEVETALSIGNHLASVMMRFSAVAKLEETVRGNELFAGVLAHDLRNPLGAIQTAAQLLLMRYEGKNPPTSDDAKPLSRIISSSERMTRMIDQLLDFTRARTGGGIELRSRATDLGELCTDVLGEFELAHPGWQIDCTNVGDLGGSWDPDRLLQVISNLVGNAGQHGDAGSRISVELDGSHPDHVTFRVHNEGSIPDALVAQLFDPFRAARHGRGRSGGLGLGLFIVQELVRAHGGNVEVSSSPAAGTTFSVRLPRQTFPRVARALA